MKIFHEFYNCNLCYKKIKQQISENKDNLEFETWLHAGIIKVRDQYELQTPGLCFMIIKNNVYWAQDKLHWIRIPYKFILIKCSNDIHYPKCTKMFNILFAPKIFMTCAREYKNKGKQK